MIYHRQTHAHTSSQKLLSYRVRPTLCLQSTLKCVNLSVTIFMMSNGGENERKLVSSLLASKLAILFNAAADATRSQFISKVKATIHWELLSIRSHPNLSVLILSRIKCIHTLLYFFCVATFVLCLVVPSIEENCAQFTFNVIHCYHNIHLTATWFWWQKLLHQFRWVAISNISRPETKFYVHICCLNAKTISCMSLAGYLVLMVVLSKFLSMLQSLFDSLLSIACHL